MERVELGEAADDLGLVDLVCGFDRIQGELGALALLHLADFYCTTIHIDWRRQGEREQ